jgi:hypothetical protein
LTSATDASSGTTRVGRFHSRERRPDDLQPHLSAGGSERRYVACAGSVGRHALEEPSMPDGVKITRNRAASPPTF